VTDLPNDVMTRGERAVLGSLLTFGYLFSQTEALSVGHFLLSAHQTIYARMAARHEDGEPIDLNLVVMDLAQRGQLEGCGGAEYLSLLVEDAAYPEVFRDYVSVVRKAAIKREAAKQIERLSVGDLASLREQLQKLQELLATHDLDRNPDTSASRELFRTAAQLSVEIPEETSWIVRGFAAAGGMTNIDAKIKMGKTTFAFAMAAAVVDGKDFLGQPTAKAPVVFLTEQPLASLTQALKRAGLWGHKDLHILRWHQVSNSTWPQIAAKARAKCVQVGAKVLIVDTVGQFAGFKTEEENSSGPWMEAMRPLQEILPDGVAVINLMHGRKSGGEVGDSARGSSAGGGVADILVSIRRPEGNHGPNFRKIESLSRFEETPSGLVIELTPEGYVARGSNDTLAVDETRVKLHACLPTDESDSLNMKQLQQETGAKRATLLRVIEEDATIKKTGRGGRVDPFRYYRADSE
jgi:hypothetical protein